MAKKKNEWLYRALCAALAVTLVSGAAVMSPIADIVGTSITANAANYTTWGTCKWKVENGKLYIKGTIPNTGSPVDIPWCADSIRTTITEVYVETGTKTSANASYLFYNLTRATSMNLSNLNTSAATDMNHMFNYCSSLASLNISGWDTSKVTDMKCMFYYCDALTSLDLSSWNTSSVKTMENMFYDCDALTSLNLSNWNTKNVTTMAYMFYSCNSLKSVDVNDWNTQNVTSMFCMFSGCNALKKIYADKDWNTSNVTRDMFMFGNCENLVGGQGTAWSNTKKTKEYARIDGGPKSATPGYFTKGHAPLTYTVTWKNYDGTTLETDEDVEEGTTPSYDGATPTKTATAQYSYTFSGWDKKITAVTGDVTYTAQFTETTNTYTVTWIDGDGNNLKTDTVAYGDTPEYNGETPTKTATAQYSYTFSGWDTTPVAVTGNATYTAQFTDTVNEYTVTWIDGDGNNLKTDTVAYGETPVYSGATPTKTATAQYSYTFSGWTPEISAVTGDVTYTAQFTETTNTYTVTWQNEDGTVLETDTDVAYGTEPTYDGATPEKTADAQYTYTFSGWTPSVDTVTGDVVYTATFTQERHFIDDTHHAWYTFDKETGHMEIYGDGQAFKKQYAFGTFTSSKPNTEVISVHLNNDNGEINTKDFTGWFQSFTSLKEVTGKFPEKVERMGSTFYNCKSLTYVEFVPEVTVAATKMFSSCTKLSSIGNADNTIKISCTSYQGVFQGCYVLNANVVFDKSLNAVNIERGYYENAFENAAVWGGNIVVCMTSNINDETAGLIKSTVVNNTSSKKQNISYHHYSDYIDKGDGTHIHTCDVCGEAETENHTFDNGICTVCSTKEDYTIKITNGIVAKGEKDIYHVGDIITLKANTPEEGKVFAYWKDGSGNVLSTKANYSFVVLQSVDLTAVYNNEHTAEAILNISAVQTSSNGKNAIRFVFNRSVDTKAQVEEVGLIYATNKLAGYTDGAKVNLSESDFDIETALKDNTNGKVKTYKGTSTSINGTIRLTYTIGNNTDCYVYAYGYVKLTDGTTLYTDLIATTYDSIV